MIFEKIEYGIHLRNLNINIIDEKYKELDE